MVSFNLEMGTLAEHVNTRPRRMAIEDHSDFLRYHRRSQPSPSPGGAVSNKLISRASPCIHCSGAGLARTQVNAGLPPNRSLVNAST